MAQVRQFIIPLLGLFLMCRTYEIRHRWWGEGAGIVPHPPKVFSLFRVPVFFLFYLALV